MKSRQVRPRRANQTTGCPEIDGPFNRVQQENKERLVHAFIVDEFATLLDTGLQTLRHPTYRVVRHFCREAALGRPGVCDESGF